MAPRGSFQHRSPARATPREPGKKTWDSSTLFKLRSDLTAVLSRKAGQLVDLNALVKGAGLDIHSDWDRGEVIWELCRMEELGRIRDGWIGSGPYRKMAWKIDPPPPEAANKPIADTSKRG